MAMRVSCPPTDRRCSGVLVTLGLKTVLIRAYGIRFARANARLIGRERARVRACAVLTTHSPQIKIRLRSLVNARTFRGRITAAHIQHRGILIKDTCAPNLAGLIRACRLAVRRVRSTRGPCDVTTMRPFGSAYGFRQHHFLPPPLASLESSHRNNFILCIIQSTEVFQRGQIHAHYVL